MAEATIPLPTARLTVRLTVRIPPAYGLRMWAFCALLRLAGRIGPHKVSIEIDAAD